MTTLSWRLYPCHNLALARCLIMICLSIKCHMFIDFQTLTVPIHFCQDVQFGKKAACRVYGHLRVWWKLCDNVCECFIWLATCVCVERWVFNEISIHLKPLKHSLPWPLAISINEDVTDAASEQPILTSPFDKGGSSNMPFIYLHFRLGVIYSYQWSHIDCIGLALFSSVFASNIPV